MKRGKHKLLSLTAVRLLRKVQKEIKAHPSHYNQQNPIVHGCGSPACICGWMEFFSDKPNPSREDTGLDREQYYRLFFASQWPVKFYKPYSGARNIKASAAIRRIEHFIQTDGRE